MALLLAACTLACTGGALSSFRGAKSPVMLGPKDRAAAPATRVASFSAQAGNIELQSQEHGIDVQHRDFQSRMAAEAIRATGDDPGLDIRIARIEGAAWVAFFGSLCSRR